MSSQSVRHIVSLSGGKDSTALAIYLRDRIPELEYVFCDTGEELPETYEYLDKLEVFLGKEIKRLKPRKSFYSMLQEHGGFLPSAQARWCTQHLKIKPFEEYVGDTTCYNYIGVRADELYRKGYISTKPNIVAKYPFIEDGITKPDVMRILEESGIGLPEYYEWRSRSGCYFCFFQRRIEWIGLSREHPELFEKAMKMEKENPETGEKYTWIAGESLEELIRPERVKEIEAKFYGQEASRNGALPDTPLTRLCGKNCGNCVDENNSCLICHL